MIHYIKQGSRRKYSRFLPSYKPQCTWQRPLSTHLYCDVELEGVDDLGVITDLTDEPLLATQGAVVDVFCPKLNHLLEFVCELVVMYLQ